MAAASCESAHTVPVEFQSAYGARPFQIAAQQRPLAVADFDDPSELVDASWSDIGEPIPVTAVTQQQAVLDAVRAAGAALQTPAAAPLLGANRCLHFVTLDALGRTARCRRSGCSIVPEAQLQGPLILDLEAGGGCLIFGSGGAGKTTALRSIALALSSTPSDRAPVAILAFDCASQGLSMLRPLPVVVDVATGDDLEAISRHLVMLDRELTRRRRILAQACAEHLSAYNAGNPPLPRIVVLIDDIGALGDLLGGQGGRALASGETWPERLVRVLVEGRQVGIHGVVTADRRNAVPARLHSAVSNRIVLGLADRLAYADHGVPPDAPELRDLPPGRGWWNGSTVIQLAVASRDHTARGQREAIDRVARASNVNDRPRCSAARPCRHPSLPATFSRAGSADCANRRRRCDVRGGDARSRGVARGDHRAPTYWQEHNAQDDRRRTRITPRAVRGRRRDQWARIGADRAVVLRLTGRDRTHAGCSSSTPTRGFRSEASAGPGSRTPPLTRRWPDSFRSSESRVFPSSWP